MVPCKYESLKGDPYTPLMYGMSSKKRWISAAGSTDKAVGEMSESHPVIVSLEAQSLPFLKLIGIFVVQIQSDGHLFRTQRKSICDPSSAFLPTRLHLCQRQHVEGQPLPCTLTQLEYNEATTKLEAKGSYSGPM